MVSSRNRTVAGPSMQYLGIEEPREGLINRPNEVQVRVSSLPFSLAQNLQLCFFFAELEQSEVMFTFCFAFSLFIFFLSWLRFYKRLLGNSLLGRLESARRNKPTEHYLMEERAAFGATRRQQNTNSLHRWPAVGNPNRHPLSDGNQLILPFQVYSVCIYLFKLLKIFCLSVFSFFRRSTHPPLVGPRCCERVLSTRRMHCTHGGCIRGMLAAC